jgi:hypothetical protein
MGIYSKNFSKITLIHFFIRIKNSKLEISAKSVVAWNICSLKASYPSS